MPLKDTDTLGLAMRFTVKIENSEYDLQSWARADGLDVSWQIAEYRAGDHDNDRWYFPGLTMYSTVKLTRAANASGTQAVRKWLESNSFKYEAQVGKIALMDAKNEQVHHWELRHLIPVKWSVSGFDAAKSNVATETLEIAHMGFLEEQR